MPVLKVYGEYDREAVHDVFDPTSDFYATQRPAER